LRQFVEGEKLMIHVGTPGGRGVVRPRTRRSRPAVPS
jgi:hypothetical protein